MCSRRRLVYRESRKAPATTAPRRLNYIFVVALTIHRSQQWSQLLQTAYNITDTKHRTVNIGKTRQNLFGKKHPTARLANSLSLLCIPGRELTKDIGYSPIPSPGINIHLFRQKMLELITFNKFYISHITCIDATLLLCLLSILNQHLIAILSPQSRQKL